MDNSVLDALRDIADIDGAHGLTRTIGYDPLTPNVIVHTAPACIAKAAKAGPLDALLPALEQHTLCVCVCTMMGAPWVSEMRMLHELHAVRLLAESGNQAARQGLGYSGLSTRVTTTFAYDTYATYAGDGGSISVPELRPRTRDRAEQIWASGKAAFTSAVSTGAATRQLTIGGVSQKNRWAVVSKRAKYHFRAPDHRRVASLFEGVTVAETSAWRLTPLLWDAPTHIETPRHIAARTDVNTEVLNLSLEVWDGRVVTGLDSLIDGVNRAAR